MKKLLLITAVCSLLGTSLAYGEDLEKLHVFSANNSGGAWASATSLPNIQSTNAASSFSNANTKAVVVTANIQSNEDYLLVDEETIKSLMPTNYTENHYIGATYFVPVALVRYICPHNHSQTPPSAENKTNLILCEGIDTYKTPGYKLTSGSYTKKIN